MPPERCEHGKVTPQTDLFSLGVTLYEALSGMRPFSLGDELSKERTARFPLVVEEPQPLGRIISIHPLLERVVMSRLVRDPSRRPRSAVEMALAFNSVLESLGTEELYAWPPGLRVQSD